MRTKPVGVAAMALAMAVSVLTAASAGAATTYGETVGVNTNTWTNYTNAGGAQGQTIPRYSTVQISCALTGFRVANGNTWWYRIASSPWNNNFYASADAFYNNGQTSGSLKGTPWVDPAVPICGAAPPPPPPPPPPPAPATVELAKGPAAPQGFRYAITLRNFPANQGITVRCYDSVSPGGFYVPFTMNTDGSGSAFTQNQCYSSDGPDHWVVANGVQSNRVSWGSSGGGQPGGGTPGGATSPTTQPKLTGPFSVFYSPNNDFGTGLSGVEAADLNVKLDQWAFNCQSYKADNFDGPNVHTLAGWSVGRLGPVYFLHAASAERVAKIRTVILIDPGSKTDFERSFWDSVFGPPPCDPRYDINSILANWLKSNDANKLIIYSGKTTKAGNYAGLWKYYLAGIWNQPFANRAMICNYDGVDHFAILRKAAPAIKSPGSSCLEGIGSWHP